MITKKDFSDYMLDVATRLKDIGHTPKTPRFARNTDELKNLANGDMDASNLILFLDAYNVQFNHNNDDYNVSNKTLTFYLLKGCEKNDFDQEEQIYADCEIVLMKIFSKMQQEKWEGGNLMRFFDLNNTTYSPVGPEVHNAFGLEVQMRFTNGVNADLVYDEADWL
ncbi:hypothetical protein V6R21_06305 [Limibacter armeniacum]|uniref:hypothetical protein n=1 Tax=Limibacter armeniacum TaxID=466084 RepID=UPI002FE66D84